MTTVQQWSDPVIPAESKFMRLHKLPCPPQFEEACGWERTIEECGWIAMFWVVAGDELYITDGMYSGTKDHHAWISFMGHKGVRYAMGLESSRYNIPMPGFSFGGSDYEAEYWLILDRKARAWFAARANVENMSKCGEIELWLRSQFPPPPPQPERLSTAEVSAFCDAMAETLGMRLTAAQVRERMSKEYLHCQRIKAWLDEQPITRQANDYLQSLTQTAWRRR